jgi:hypothetical protein
LIGDEAALPLPEPVGERGRIAGREIAAGGGEAVVDLVGDAGIARGVGCTRSRDIAACLLI